MVVVPLKSQFVSVIITLISTVSEAFVFCSFIRFNRYYENHRLRKGEQLRIRAHLNRSKIAAAIATIFFIVLELFVSFYTDPARIIKNEIYSCVSLDSVRTLRQPVVQFIDLRSETVKSQCSFVENGIFIQKAGNVTEDGGSVLVQCSEETVFSFNASELHTERMLPTIKPTMGCSSCSNMDPRFGECLTLCAFVVAQNNSVFHSVSTSPEWAREMDANGEAQKHLTYLGTDVHFSTDDLQKEMAQRAAQTYADSITDPIAQRRRILMGLEERSCDFSVDRGEGTVVPVALIIAISSVWLSSLILVLCSLLLLGRNLFDVSDPLQWAFRSIRKDDAPIERDPAIRIEKGKEDSSFFLSEAVQRGQR